MTGFASEEYSHESLSVTCDIKTINHRFLDVSIRSHELPNDVDVFINLRYVGGGAEGTESEPIDGKDGFVANWIHLGALSIGVRAR